MPHSGRLGGSGRSFDRTHQSRRQTQGSHEQHKAAKFTGLPDFSNADGSRIDITGSTVNSSRGRAVAQVVLGMFVFATAGSLVSASTGSKSSSGSKPSSSGDGNKGSKPSSSAKGGIQKGGVQFDDFQAGNKVSESVSPVRYEVIFPDLKKEGVSYSTKEPQKREVFSTPEGTQSFEVFQGAKFSDLKLAKKLDKLKTAQRYAAPGSRASGEAIVRASYDLVQNSKSGTKCDFFRDIFGACDTLFVDYRGNLVNTLEGFLKYLPRSLPVLQYYSNDFPARSGDYHYELPGDILMSMKELTDETGIPKEMEKRFQARDDNGRSVFDILCVLAPEGDFTVQTFRPDTIRHSDKAGVPSLFYALMASKDTFTDAMMKIAEDGAGLVGHLQHLQSKLNEKKDLFDNPGKTLTKIAASLHRDVNEAYNAQALYVSGTGRNIKRDVEGLYTLPFPCACEGLVSSSAFKACTEDYVGLVADMKKAGILFRKSVELSDGGDESFKKVGQYLAVSPGPEDKSSYEVPVITKANAKAISDYFKSNRKAFDKWMDIKERVANDGIAVHKGGEKDKGHKVSAVKPSYSSFLKYLNDEHEALAEVSILKGLRINFSRNLATMKKAIEAVDKESGVYYSANL